VRVTWHPVDREVAEKEKSARAEVLIILGVEGLALCRHPATCCQGSGIRRKV